VINFKRKLRLTIVGLGGCFAIVVMGVFVTVRHLVAGRGEFLRITSVQADLRSLDQEFDDARTEIDGFLLTGDSAHFKRSDQHLAHVESIFDRLVSPAEGDASQLRSLTRLRTQMNELEQALEFRREIEHVGVVDHRLPVLEASDRLAIEVRERIGKIDSVSRQATLRNSEVQEANDRQLWFAILALAAIGISIAVLSYRSMRRDLSDQERATRAVAESESKYSGILAIAADAIVTADEQGRIVNFNRSAEVMFGCRATSVIGQPLHNLVPYPFNDGETPADAIRRVGATLTDSGGERRDLTARRCTGETFAVEAAVSRLATSTGFLLTAVLRDVTEQRRSERREHLLAEAATRLSPQLSYEEQLSMIAQLAVPTVGDWCILDVIDTGDDGRKLIRRVTSTPVDHQHEGAMWELEANAPHWAANDPVTDVIRSGKPLFVRGVADEWIDTHYRDEKTRTIMKWLGVDSLIFAPLVVDSGTIGVLTIGASVEHPATEEKSDLALVLAGRGAPAIEAARLYRQSQRATAARDALLGIVSHDLIGALGTISMHALSLQAHEDGDRERHAMLCQNILDGTTVMHRLMLDLVDISAIETHQLTITPTVQALTPIMVSVRQMFTPRAEAQGITLHVDDAIGLPDARADATRIVQVLSNLVDNALKHTPAGGTVDVRVDADAKDILVSVRDAGAGVGADELPHIFERFWRARANRRTRGFGLGLAIVNGIITTHRGRVWMESTMGRGSTVFFTLPRANLTQVWNPPDASSEMATFDSRARAL
jgi:PAS domain S-box-containing protein